MLVELVAKVVRPFRRAQFHSPAGRTVCVLGSHQNRRDRVHEIEYYDLLLTAFCPCSAYSVDVIRVPLHNGEEGSPEVLTAQCFLEHRFFGIGPPSDTVRVAFTARTNSNLSLCRVKEQLDIADVLKGAHAEKIE